MSTAGELKQFCIMVIADMKTRLKNCELFKCCLQLYKQFSGETDWRMSVHWLLACFPSLTSPQFDCSPNISASKHKGWNSFQVSGYFPKTSHLSSHSAYYYPYHNNIDSYLYFQENLRYKMQVYQRELKYFSEGNQGTKYAPSTGQMLLKYACGCYCKFASHTSHKDNSNILSDW